MKITKKDAEELGLIGSVICDFHESHPDQKASLNSCHDCYLIREPCGCDEYSGCEHCKPEDFKE